MFTRVVVVACALLPFTIGNAHAQTPSHECALELCQQECAADLMPFLDACWYCDIPAGNCATEACMTQFEGCLPGEICDTLYGEMVNGLCIMSNSHAGCIADTLATTDTCHCPMLEAACVDECADEAANNCSEHATCTDTDRDFSCACNPGYLGDGVECERDADSDGDPESTDCDDAHAGRYNGAAEICDGVDNDCDSMVDEAQTDTDADGRCDAIDLCAGHDDSIDTDSDGTPNGCDECPDDATNDTDADGVCNDADICAGHDDHVDADGDGTPDGCDSCPNDATNDTDQDGVCDSTDQCEGHDDAVDADGDGTPDGCDDCVNCSEPDAGTTTDGGTPDGDTADACKVSARANGVLGPHGIGLLLLFGWLHRRRQLRASRLLS